MERITKGNNVSITWELTEIVDETKYKVALPTTIDLRLCRPNGTKDRISSDNYTITDNRISCVIRGTDALIQNIGVYGLEVRWTDKNGTRDCRATRKTAFCIVEHTEDSDAEGCGCGCGCKSNMSVTSLNFRTNCCVSNGCTEQSGSVCDCYTKAEIDEKFANFTPVEIDLEADAEDMYQEATVNKMAIGYIGTNKYTLEVTHEDNKYILSFRTENTLEDIILTKTVTGYTKEWNYVELI